VRRRTLKPFLYAAGERNSISIRNAARTLVFARQYVKASTAS